VITHAELEALRDKINTMTDVLTVYEENEIDMAKPHLKLTYTGFEWFRPYTIICIKFSLIHYSSGKGMRFLTDTVNSCIKFSTDMFVDPLNQKYSEQLPIYITDGDNKKYFKVFDNKGETPMQIINGMNIFARPYKLEYYTRITNN